MKKFILVIVLAALSGCNATMKDHILDTGDQSQMQKRSYQSRVFDTNDKEKVLRGVISTLQDLAFIIDRADMTLGSVSATKIDKGLPIRITVSVRTKGQTQISVRANAQFNLKPVEDPKPYQDLFSSLEKSLFLTAQLGE